MLICLLIKKLYIAVSELFVRETKLNIFFCFLTQVHFAVRKIVRQNSMHYFTMKIPNKQELQQVAFNHSLDIVFRDFINLYKNYTAKPNSCLVIDATLASDNLSCFRKNLLERM